MAVGGVSLCGVGAPTPRRTDSRIVRPWLTRPAAISPRPSAPLSTVPFAPARPAAASLTICGNWAISSWSSATRLFDAAASAAILVRSASAMARIFTFSASASAGLITSETSCCWRSWAWCCASSAWAEMTARCASACASGPDCAASACALSISALYWACTTAVCLANSACLRADACTASADAWSAWAWAIFACRWIAALFGAAIAAI